MTGTKKPTATELPFTPNWTVSPGETIKDVLVQRWISIGEFARTVGLSQISVDQLLAGELDITRDVAERLEITLGAPAAFWINRESQYRADQRRLGLTAVAHPPVMVMDQSK